MRITTKQRRLLLEIARCERHEAAVRRRKDAGVTIEAANMAGSVAFAAGVSEGSVLSALKRLEARGLVEKLPRDDSGDFAYSTWGTRWRLTGAGQKALSSRPADRDLCLEGVRSGRGRNPTLTGR